jgi:hypothetical protein
VPLVYHVPALIKHPVWVPLVYAFKYPDPEKVPLSPIGLELALDAVVLVVVVVIVVDEVETGLPDLGRYLIPVDEQLEVCPTGEVGTKVPVCTEPRTS